ncbi:MAG: large repetitive protein, partial [Acidimicrobiaceae bacterium]
MKTRSVWALAVVVLATLLVGVVGVQPASAAPAVSSISPTSLGQGAANVDLVVNGSGFDPTLGAPYVTVSGTGVTVNSTVMNSASKLTANVSVASGAATGQRTVTVHQGAGGLTTANCTNCLTITAGPTISGAPSPSSAVNTGGPPTLVTVSGTNFVSGAELRLQRPEFADIVATGVIVNGAGTSISGTFNVTGQAAAYWKVVVINPDKGRAEFGNLTNSGFLISGSAPTLTDVAPAERSAGTTGTVLTLTGTNFARGATVTFSPNVGGTEITTSNPTWVSLTSFQVTVNISGSALPGARDVTFTNFDTQPDTCSGCFTVTGPPSVTDVTPDSRGQGAQNQLLAVTGTNFVDTPTVTFSGSGVTVDNVQYDDAEHLQVQIDVASGAAAGSRTMTVTNPDGGSDTITFSVNLAPVVSSATPASRGQNAQTQDIVITGANFVNGAGLSVVFSGTGVTEASPPTWTDAQHITAHVNVSSTAATTARDVTVTNPDKGVGTGTGKFTVTAGPTISSLAPNALARGVSHHTVVVNGANFQTTPTIKFFNGATEDTNITVHSVTRDSSVHLTLDVSVLNADTAGSRDVLVTNPDAGNSLAEDAFTVTTPPTIDSITPNSAGQGSTTTGVLIEGSGFVATPTVTFSGSGVTASNVQVNSPTELSLTVTITEFAAGNSRDVTVTNPDSGSATKPTAFTVIPGPHITSITPPSGANSGSVSITNLAGSGFAANAQVTLERNGFTPVEMQGETVNGGGTQISGTFPLSNAGAGGTRTAPGAWSVKVVNPSDAGTDTLDNGFTVTSSAPTVTGTYVQQQGTSFPREITGSNFADGAAVTVSGSGVTAGTATVTDATHLTVTLTVTGSAALGTRNITVTNADTQAGTCTGCLTIRTNPTITSVDPTARGQGTTHKSLAVNGSGFDASPTITFSGTGITVHSLIRNSASLLTLDISIDSNAALGDRDVTVTNSDQGSNTLQEGFAVTAKPGITDLSPNARGQGAAHQSIAVNG